MCEGICFISLIVLLVQEVWQSPVFGVLSFQIQEKLKRLKHLFEQHYQHTLCKWP